jgi:hypothetical protein
MASRGSRGTSLGTERLRRREMTKRESIVGDGETKAKMRQAIGDQSRR